MIERTSIRNLGSDLEEDVVVNVAGLGHCASASKLPRNKGERERVVQDSCLASLISCKVGVRRAWSLGELLRRAALDKCFVLAQDRGAGVKRRA